MLKKLSAVFVCFSLSVSFIFGYDVYFNQGVRTDWIITNSTEDLRWGSESFLNNHFLVPYFSIYSYIPQKLDTQSFYESLPRIALNNIDTNFLLNRRFSTRSEFLCCMLGGATFGEIFHRLYLEIAPISWLSLLVSPFDFIMHYFSGEPQPQRARDGVTGLKIFFSPTAMGTIKITENYKSTDPFLFAGEYGISLNYGNPFHISANTPYSAFDADLEVAMTQGFISVMLLTEGLLHKFKHFYTENGNSFIGLAMETDAVISNLYSYANYGFAAMYKLHLAPNNLCSFKLNTAVGFAPFAGAENYIPLTVADDIPQNEKPIEYDYCMGICSKHRAVFSHRRIGNFHALWICNMFFNFPQATSHTSGEGHHFINHIFLSYDKNLSENFALGLEASIYVEYTAYYGKDSILVCVPSLSLCGKFILI